MSRSCVDACRWAHVRVEGARVGTMRQWILSYDFQWPLVVVGVRRARESTPVTGPTYALGARVGTMQQWILSYDFQWPSGSLVFCALVRRRLPLGPRTRWGRV